MPDELGIIPALISPPRGVSFGIAVELFGIAVCLAGLATGRVEIGAGAAYVPNGALTGLGVFLALIGLGLLFRATPRPGRETA